MWESTLKKHLSQNLYKPTFHESLNNSIGCSSSDNNWDEFYKVNQDNFFKDRHYLLKEFSDLKIRLDSGKPTKLLELGCGCANAVVPLLNEFSNLEVVALDISPTAVSLVNNLSIKNPKIGSRLKAFVCDISKPNFLESSETSELKNLNFDFVTSIFVLSALSPEGIEFAIKNIKSVLKLSGKVFFRDYAIGDLSELRFDPVQRLDLQQFVREDLTTSFFFTKVGLELVFTEAEFKVNLLEYHEKVVVNKKDKVEMNRIFLTGIFEST